MYPRDYRIVKLLECNNNSNIYICELLNNTEIIEQWDGNYFILKEYNSKKEYERTSERLKKIADLSFKIDGLCNIIGVFNNKNYVITVKGTRKCQCNGILMEYIEGHTLEKFIRYGNYGEKEINKIILDLSKIIYDMHQNKLIHRDLKPDNIIISKKGRIKIIDLAYAAIGCQFRQQSGTPIYVAPEVIEAKIYNHKVDIYSFGILVYKLIDRKDISDYLIGTEEQNFDKAMKKLSKGYDEIIDGLAKGNKWNNHWKEIVKNCLKCDPEKRWDANELYAYAKENLKI